MKEKTNTWTSREAGPDDVDALASVLAEGFADDAAMLWSLGSPRPLYTMFAQLARALYLPRGAGTLLQNEEGTSAGAALWLHANASKSLSLLPTLRIAAAVLRHGDIGSVSRTLWLDGLLEKLHPPEPHVYLFAVALRPAFQGRGLGRHVLAPMLAHCDHLGLPAYLENSKARNLSFYQGNGFKVIEELHPGRDCPPLWRMYRDPQ